MDSHSSAPYGETGLQVTHCEEWRRNFVKSPYPAVGALFDSFFNLWIIGEIIIMEKWDIIHCIKMEI